MDAQDLIAEVADIVQDDSFSSEAILNYLNQGQLAVASKLRLPGLSDGYGVVTTVTDDNRVILPADYHKSLYLVQINGRPIKYFANKGMLFREFGRLSIAHGSVDAVCVDTVNLLYQRVPGKPVDIELFYYRLPEPMMDDPGSYPDGLTAQNQVIDHYYWALIHYACAVCFRRIEDGMEGRKINTQYHEAGYRERLEEMRINDRESRPFPRPPVTRARFP